MYKGKYDLGQSLPGIYLITFLNTKYVYIGSSYNVYKRLAEHLRRLTKNNHENVILQRLYSKYGEEKIRLIPILYCEKEDTVLQEKEVYYYNFLKEKFKLINFVYPVRNTLPIEYQKGRRGVCRRTNSKATGVTLTKSGKYLLRFAAFNNGKGEDSGRFSTYEEAHMLYQQSLMINDVKELIEFRQGCKNKARKQAPRKYKYSGVTKRYKNSWEAIVYLGKSTKWLGSYASEKEAAFAYNNYILENKLNRKLNTIEE